MVAEIADLELPAAPPDGVRLATVDDDAGVATMLAVHDEVFGPGTTHPGVVEAVRTALGMRPRPIEAVIAWAGDVAVSAGRVEFHEGTDFASLWGGGTLPEWRGRGVFRALVGHRAVLARDRGFRYLQVDALPTSRPILQRMGFQPLAETTPWTHGASPPTRTALSRSGDAPETQGLRRWPARPAGTWPGGAGGAGGRRRRRGLASVPAAAGGRGPLGVGDHRGHPAQPRPAGRGVVRRERDPTDRLGTAGRRHHAATLGVPWWNSSSQPASASRSHTELRSASRSGSRDR